MLHQHVPRIIPVKRSGDAPYLTGLAAGDRVQSRRMSVACVSIDHSGFRASMLTILYCLLVVVACGSLIDPGFSYFVVVPAGLLIGLLLTNLSFLIRPMSAPARMRDARRRWSMCCITSRMPPQLDPASGATRQPTGLARGTAPACLSYDRRACAAAEWARPPRSMFCSILAALIPRWPGPIPAGR